MPTTNQNPDQIRWNQKYQKKGIETFDLTPSAWLSTHETLIQEQPRGRALDLACGNGRNALYLAKLGFQVDAFDISDVAVTWLNQKAANEGLPLTARVVDLETEELASNHYQVVTNFRYLQRDLFSSIQKALASGGLVFFETFFRAAIDCLGSKMPLPYVLDYNELLHAFLDLRILEYRESIETTASSLQKQALASLVAQKS